MSKPVSNLTKQIINLLERGMKVETICKTLKCNAKQVYRIRFNYKAEIKKAKVAAKKAAKFVPPSKTPPLVKHKVKLSNPPKEGDTIGGLTLTRNGDEYRWVRDSALPILPAPKTTDYVNNPPHYTKGGIEVIDFIEAKGFGYNLGNVVKYISRVDLKSNALEDLQKAEWYLKREIAKRRGKEYYHNDKHLPSLLRKQAN